MDQARASRYLSLIGVAPAAPTLALLTDLVTAHLARIPFENISKLIRHGSGAPPVRPPLDEFLDGIESANLGGTCYACAMHVHDLLRHLGFEVSLCGAAMSEPDVHVVNVVALDGADYLVDVGYGAPLFDPLPLDTARPLVVEHGNDRYVLRPRDPAGRSRLDHLRDGRRIHGYTLDPTPRRADHFDTVVARSFGPDAEFLNCLRVLAHSPTDATAVRDLTITVRTDGTERTRTLPDAATLCGVLEPLLGIPASVTAEAVGVLRLRPGGWPAS